MPRVKIAIRAEASHNLGIARDLRIVPLILGTVEGDTVTLDEVVVPRTDEERLEVARRISRSDHPSNTVSGNGQFGEFGFVLSLAGNSSGALYSEEVPYYFLGSR